MGVGQSAEERRFHVGGVIAVVRPGYLRRDFNCDGFWVLGPKGGSFVDGREGTMLDNFHSFVFVPDETRSHLFFFYIFFFSVQFLKWGLLLRCLSAALPVRVSP